MRVHELISQMIANKTWLPWCAVSDDAATKNIQYSIYKMVEEREPARTYGYRVRLCNSANNTVKIIGGGVFVLTDPKQIERAISAMERVIYYDSLHETV